MYFHTPTSLEFGKWEAIVQDKFFKWPQLVSSSSFSCSLRKYKSLDAEFIVAANALKSLEHNESKVQTWSEFVIQ